MEDWFSVYEQVVNSGNEPKVKTPNEIPSKLAGKVFGGVEWNPLSFGRYAPIKFSRYTKFLEERGFQPNLRTAQFYEASCRNALEWKLECISDERIAEQIKYIPEDKREQWIKRMHRYDYLKVVYDLAVRYMREEITKDEMFTQIPDDESCEKTMCKLGCIFQEPFVLLRYYTKFSDSWDLSSIAAAYERYDPKLFEAEIKIFRDAAELGNTEEGIFYAWSHMGLLYYSRSKYVIDQGKDFYAVSNLIANKKEFFKSKDTVTKSSSIKRSTSF